MFYLLLSVLSSSAVAVIMRFGEKHIKNNFAMFTANYFVCSTIAFLFIDGGKAFVITDGFPFALGLGLFSGCLYLASFILMKLNISKNGVMLTSVFMKLGVLVPAVLAVAAFGETPSILQIIGFALAIGAILLIYIEPAGGDKGQKKTAFFLILLLLVSGMTESMMNIYDKLGNPALKNNVLFYNFLTAMLFAATVTLIQRKPVSWKDIVFGIMIGIPNYFASRFLLLSLGTLPAVAVYPVYNVGAIVLIGLFGMLLFKERLTKRKYIGFGIILISLVLLNI